MPCSPGADGTGTEQRGILWAGWAASDPPGIVDRGHLVTPKSFQVVRKSRQFGELYDKACQVDGEKLPAVLETLVVVGESNLLRTEPPVL